MATHKTDYKTRFEECNDKFNTVFELTSAASKIINSDLTILKVNKAVTELLGYSAEEIEGTQILDYACPEYVDHWHELQNGLWSRKLPFFKLEACLFRKDKSIAWVSVTTVLFNDEQETYGFTVLDDITYRKEFEESEKRLNLALQHSNVAVWEMNLKDGSVIRSAGHDRLFGYEEQLDLWTRETYYDHFLDDDLPLFKEVINSAIPDNSIDFKGRIQTKQGIVRWLHFEGRAEPQYDSKPPRILGTVNDITKEKLAERHKDDFITIASHELKTPITGLKASLQLLNRMKDNPTEKLPGLIDQANKSITKVNVLVDDLLNASKVYEDQLHLKKTNFNLSDIIQNCCNHVQVVGVYKIITEGDNQLEVFADAERIERVVVNMVNNAIKYAADSKEIYIRIEKVNGNARVSVTDKGPGITPEKIPYLFDRYYRADNNGNQYSGLGLGLYISAEIIRKHNGQIGVDSELGKGSTFWFTLPLQQ